MKLFAVSTASLLFGVILFFPQTVVARTDPLEDLCARNPRSSVCTERDNTQTATNNRVIDVLAFAVNTFSWIIGIAGVIAVIVGSLMYVISGGDPQKTNQAKNTIIYALVGLVIAAFAQLIIFFVLDRLTL